MALEKELVLRGSYDPNCRFIKENKAVVFIQYETHQHLEKGMITNRCRQAKYPDGRVECSTATKYVFNKGATSKEAEEIEVSIDEQSFTTIASMLDEGVVKARYTIQQESYAIEIDVFLDLGTRQWTTGFKIDIEGETPPDQSVLEKQLDLVGFTVTEWLNPQEWGSRYNAKVRLKRSS